MRRSNPKTTNAPQDLSSKMARAEKKARQKLGEEEFTAFRNLWQEKKGKTNQSEGDEVIKALVGKKLSHFEIRAICQSDSGGLGGYRLDRCVKEMKGEKPARKTNGLEFGEAVIDDLKHHCEGTWKVDEGTSCPHREQESYFAEKGLTWSVLHKRYAIVMQAESKQVMSYSRWLQYVHFLYPGYRLTRAGESECHACLNLAIRLDSPHISATRKGELMAIKMCSRDAAFEQRANVNDFIEICMKDNNVPCPDRWVFLPTRLQDDIGLSYPRGLPTQEQLDLDQKVTVQMEGFGIPLPLPYSSWQRASSADLQQSLALHQFIVCDAAAGVNHLFFFDERCQKEDTDVLCSLRLAYHFKKLRSEKPPRVSLSVLDEHSEMEKTATIFKFYALMSILFYERVMLLFMPSGHTHLRVDHVAAQARHCVRKTTGLMSPAGLVQRVNESNTNVKAIFVDHEDPERCAWVGWKVFLDKYFSDIPAEGLGANCYFEFWNGKVIASLICVCSFVCVCVCVCVLWQVSSSSFV